MPKNVAFLWDLWKNVFGNSIEDNQSEKKKAGDEEKTKDNTQNQFPSK